MGPAPPGLGVCGKATVRRPGVSSVELVEHKVLSDLLWIAHALEAAHVLARREHVSILNFGVHPHDFVHDVILIGEHSIPALRFGKDKLAPDKRRVLYSCFTAMRDFFIVDCIKILGKKSIQLFFGEKFGMRAFAGEHQVECVVIFVFRINAIGCKPHHQDHCHGRACWL